MTYAIFVKYNPVSEWVQLSNKWYISPKKAISAYNSSNYGGLNVTKYHQVKIVERKVEVIDTDIEWDFKTK